MKSIRSKLLISYLVVLAVGMLVTLVALFFAVPFAYNRHMMGGNPQMMQHMQGQGSQRGQVGFSDFRAGVFEALGYAALVASLVAVSLGIYFSHRIISPLRELTQASRRISDGRYDERVRIEGQDELAELASQFNQMAEKIEQTESMRRRLIGDVSHELRTPLTAIRGSVEGLIDGVLPASGETFGQIHQEAERLGRLVDDLQEISRVEARAYSLDLRPLNAADVVQTVIKRFQRPFDEKRISLTANPTSDLPRVQADEDRLIQVLTNLTANALQYTPSEGKVTVSARKEAGYVRFSVEDNGTGIPGEHQDHIFDRFYRIDKSRSRQAGAGSGIGLTIAKHLVEAQGGRIWVESPGSGHGSTFHFTIPVVRG